MSSGRPRNVIDVKFRPLESGAQGSEIRYETLVHFRYVEDRVSRIDAFEVINDLLDRRFGATKIETRLGAQGVRPGRRKKCHDAAGCREAVLAKQFAVIAAQQLDGCAERARCCERSCRRWPARTRSQALPRSVGAAESRTGRCTSPQKDRLRRTPNPVGLWRQRAQRPRRCDFPGDRAPPQARCGQGCERRAHATGPASYRRAKPRRIAKAVAAKFFDLPQLDDLVALGRTEQKVTIITRNVGIGHLSPLSRALALGPIITDFRTLQ